MEKISDLDYILTKDGIFYIARGYYHTENGIFARPVFWPDENGDRLHPQYGRYKKDITEFDDKIFSVHPEYRHNFVPHNCPLVVRNDIVEVFHPRDKIKTFLEKEKGTRWHEIVSYLETVIKVPIDDIGIFGSYLVGLNKNTEGRHIKDVDFVIYGMDNLLAVKKGMEKLLAHFNFNHISAEHIKYHAEKFGKQFMPGTSSFEKTLANKWSSIQIAPGMLNTLRFVYKENEIPPNPIKSDVKKICTITGTVIEVLLKNSSVKSSVAGGGRYDELVQKFLGRKFCTPSSMSTGQIPATRLRTVPLRIRLTAYRKLSMWLQGRPLSALRQGLMPSTLF